MRGDACPHTLRSHPPLDLQGEHVFFNFWKLGEREFCWGRRGRGANSLSITDTITVSITTLSFDIQRNPSLQLAPNLHIWRFHLPHIGARRVTVSVGAFGGARDAGQR